MFSTQQAGTVKAQRKKLTANQKRLDELNRLFKRIYEDMVSQRITEKRFEMLSGDYEREQAELEQSIAEIQAELDSFDDSADRAEKFLALARRYQDFSELTTPMVTEFIQKIIVHERAEKNKRFTTQNVEIFINFIDDFAPPQVPQVSEEPASDAEQTEAERKREYHREYHRRRRANGGKPLTPPDTRTPEQIAADEAAKTEKRKAYNREYQREWHRRKAQGRITE